MSPKSLLRHPEARSSWDEIVPGTYFKRVINDKGPVNENPSGVKKVVFCSGKVFYDLNKERDKLGLQKDVAICRIEQVCPFPFDLVKEEVSKFPNASVTWSQEEHKNQGVWQYVQPRLMTSIKDLGRGEIHYAGRSCSASTATGSKHQHKKELASLLAEAFHLE